jgi:hypothetical protein
MRQAADGAPEPVKRKAVKALLDMKQAPVSHFVTIFMVI